MPDTLTRADPPTETNHRRLGKLTDQPWWTQADQAELDALWWEWCIGQAEHRDRCTACLEHERVYGGQWCASLQAALQVVLDFRESRIRVSKAQWLRLTNDVGLNS